MKRLTLIAGLFCLAAHATEPLSQPREAIDYGHDRIALPAEQVQSPAQVLALPSDWRPQASPQAVHGAYRGIAPFVRPGAPTPAPAPVYNPHYTPPPPVQCPVFGNC